MIEKLLKAYLVEKKTWYGSILGFIFASLGIIFALFIFRTGPSFPAIFLTTLAIAPLIIKIIKDERQEKSILKRHEKIIQIYFYLFFGMTVAFAVFNAFLPSEISNAVFSEQLIKLPTVGYFTQQSMLLLEIVLNNLGLVLFFFLLSLFYGSGSVFLLSWNASILGVIWGNILKVSLSLMNPFVFVNNVLFIFPFLLPEIEAYFLASVAGGIVSVNLENKNKLETAMNDSLVFLVLSIVLIFAAGAIEAFLIA